MPVHMNLLVAQLPLATEIAGAQQASIQAQAETARQTAFESLVQQRNQVPQVEEGEGMNAVDKDRSQQEQQQQRRGRRRQREPDPEAAPTLHAHAEGPWQGGIINTKV